MQSKIRTVHELNNTTVAFCTLLAVIFMGCAGTPNTPVPNPPVISTMTLDTNSANLNDGGGFVPVTFTFNWSDQDGDVNTMWVDIGYDYFKVPLPDAYGKTSGVVHYTVNMKTTTHGTFYISPHLVDAYGHASNARTLNFVVN